MTQFPNAYAPEAVVEQRTSILAIVALVAVLICCVPFLSVIGVITAVFALVAIGKSNGRLGGKGVAMAALILGLIISAFWIAAAVGTSMASRAMMTGMVGPMNKLMADLEAKNYDAVRAGFTPLAGQRITNADIDRFVEEYHKTNGAYQHGPETFWSMVSMWMELGPRMQQFQGQQAGGQAIIPYPATFQNGTGLIALQVDQSGQSAGKMPILNLKLINADGTNVLLYDPAALPEPARKDLPETKMPGETKLPGSPTPK